MSNCPKCNHNLKITDWRQNCPYCGANIQQYDLFNRLMRDADNAEVQLCCLQPKIDRLKAALIGSKLAIARIVFSILPVAALFLPLVSGNFSAPFASYTGNVNIIKVFKLAENVSAESLLELLKNPASKLAAIALIVCISALALSVLQILLHLVLLTLSRSPKGKQRNLIQDILLLIVAGVSGLSFAAMPVAAFATGRLWVGAYLYAVLLIANLVVDLLALREKIEIAQKPGFVGGIPIDEYLKLLEENTPEDEIRARMFSCLSETSEEQNALASQ